jgi:type I restriction and modification enzyme subunit R-like protein/N-6 DNA methylase
MTAPDVVLELIERFDRNRDTYRQAGYKEAQLRQEFIDPLFEALGWDMSNKGGYAEAYKDVIHEDSLKIGGETKAPDYCLRVGGTRKFFIEAKKPAINVKMDADAAYQLKRYAWSAKLPLSVLTNFDVLAVYDCTSKPVQLAHPANARLLVFTYKDYASRWGELVALLSREAVLKGLFDTFAGVAKTKRGTAEVDSAFLAEIDSWRSKLARNLNARNPQLSASTLNWAVQQTIDRIVFLRICEDRGIEPYGQLRAAATGKGAYAGLGQRFQQADDKFNSGLFHFQSEKGREAPDTITLGLTLDDSAVRAVVAGLYYPDSPYEFSVLPPDILGRVYEQFLGKTIVVDAGQTRVELRPEVAKAGGVYYTPSYIVDRINADTIGPLLTQSTAQAFHSGGDALRILDPACGSGRFLLDAYQKLLDWYLTEYLVETKRWSKGPTATVREDSKGGWRLTTGERKRILLALSPPSRAGRA